MKYLINKIDSKDLNEFGTDGYVLGSDDNFYSYQVEFGTNPGEMEEVAISDGCNRYIPVAVENIPDLIIALASCWNSHVQVMSVQNLTDNIMSDECEAYVNDKQLEFNF